MTTSQVLLRRAIAAFFVLIASTTLAFDTPSPNQIRALEYRHHSMWWGSVSRSLDALPPATRSDLSAQLSQLGVQAEHAQFDVRSGRWSTLLLTQPLIPGSGVGNRLGWSDLGRSEPASLSERENAVWQAFAGFLDSHRAQLGFASEEFGEASISLHDERLIQIHLGRQLDGIPVRDSYLTAAINSGNLVLMGQRNWADIELDTTPSLRPETARQALDAHIAGLVSERDREAPHLVIVPVAEEANDEAIQQIGAGLDFRLAWVFSPYFDFDIGTWEALVDAHSGELLRFTDLNHYAEQRSVIGGKFPVSNDGIAPDGVEQGGMPMPFADIRVGGTQIGFATSGGVIPETAGAGPISTILTGQYVRINDTCGAVNQSSASGDLDLGTGVGTNCQVPAGSSAGNTRAARTTYYGLNRIQEQARGYLPNNIWLTQRVTANTNVNQTCNATWNGSVNMFRAGNGCFNTGELMPVVHHEWGHGMDANNGAPGVSRPGEGIADIFAQNMLLDSCIGRNFTAMQCSGFGDACLSCTGVRESDWARRASGQPHDIAWVLSPSSAPGGGCFGTPSGNSPCGSSVHCEGSIIAEALWDFVHRDLRGFEGSPFNLDLNTALELGTRLTYLGSNNVTSWFQCNPGSGTGNGCNASGGYLNFLAADDDNGSLLDGTPHMSAIHAAFNRHGLACDTLTVQNSGCSGRPDSAPQNIVARGLDASAALTWDPVQGAEEYWVFRSEGIKGCDFGKALVGRTTGTSFLETGLRNDFGLLYNVMAVGGQSSCSGPMSPCIEVMPSVGARGELVGMVSHSSTGELLGEVLIEAIDDELVFGTRSAESGEFSLRLPIGTYQVEVSAPGFTSEQFELVIAEDEQTALEVSLDAPVVVTNPERIDLSLAQGQGGETLLSLANPSGQTLEWTVFADGSRGSAERAADPARSEVLDLPNFQVRSTANGGSPVLIELPAGIASRGEVLGFRFQGTVSGVSGNQSWASDLCMLVESPDGQRYGVGGFGATQQGCNVNPWDFAGNQSANNGTYQSQHPAVFDPPASDLGTWRFTFINDWNSSQAATMSWSNVTVTLIKQPSRQCSEIGAVAWLSLPIDSGSTAAGELDLLRLQLNAEQLEVGRNETELCVQSNDPLRALLVIPVVVDVLAAAAAPELLVSEALLDFGEVFPGQTASLSLSISNQAADGALPLNLGSSLLQGDAVFELVAGDCEIPGELAPGASCSLEINFQPPTEADYAGSLWIVTGNGQLAEIALRGLGRKPDPVFSDGFRDTDSLPPQ